MSKEYQNTHNNKIIYSNGIEEKMSNILSIKKHGALATKIIDIIKGQPSTSLDFECVISQYKRAIIQDNILVSNIDDIEDVNEEIKRNSKKLVKRKYF